MPTESSSVPLNLSGRIPELDGLRGIAIGSVLIWHYFIGSTVAAPATPLSYALALGRLAWSGVDLFFVLSGFLIGGILLDARKSTNYFRIFYTRRFFRIVPIYAAVLLALPALLYVAQRTTDGDFSWLFLNDLPRYSYWTFTQNFWMAHAATLGGSALSVTWSLAIEEQFYLTLPLVVRFLSGRKLLYFVIAGISLAPILRTAVHFLWPHNWLPAFVLMPCRADALLLGVLAAILLRDPSWKAQIQRANLFFAVSLPLLLLGVAFFDWKSSDVRSLLMQTIGFSWMALFYVLLLLFALTRPASLLSRALRVKALAWLGGIAYGVYLMHDTILGLLFGFVWGNYPQITGGATLLTALAALVLTLVIARLSWRFFEQPLIRFGHRSGYNFGESGTKELIKSAPELAGS